MDAEDLAQVADSLRQAVEGQDRDTVRREVTEFGWHDLLEEDAQAAVATLATLQGELLLPTSFLDDVLLAAAGLNPSEQAAVVLPPAGRLEPASSYDGADVSLDGVVQAGGVDRLLVVPARRDDRLVLLAGRTSQPVDATGTIDPDAGWAKATGSLTGVEVLLEGDAAERAWERMAAAGRRALAHELVAVGGQMLRLTLEHVTTREQFGRTLASFQVVKHKLADVRLWQEVATLSADAAWEDGGGESAALAKAAACRFTAAAREHCQQLLGGMGFTWEHAFHTYLRRALVLESLLGSAKAQHRLLGAALRAGRVPAGLGGL